MSKSPPYSHPYNLNRLGQAGDDVVFQATDQERVALAQFAGVLRVQGFAGRVELKKLSQNRFRLDFALDADIVQACVVTLADVPTHIECRFTRELHFSPALRRPSEPLPAAEVPLEGDAAEEIDSLHFDLFAPLVEEFVLAIDPYPRAAGVEFHPVGEVDEAPKTPFAVIKGLKSGL